jgi:hypothetical protein
MSSVLLLTAVLMFSCASAGGAKTDQAAPGIKYSWSFDDPAAGTAGWYMVPDEYWDFHGTAELSRDDTTFGKGMLRMDIDYTKDSNSEWSEPKMKMEFNTPIEGMRKFTFDILFNPEFSKGGHFKSKIIVYNDKKSLADNGSDAIIALDELPNGYVKGTVTLTIRTVSQPVNNMLFSIAGYKTDYKGPIFFDNIRWE